MSDQIRRYGAILADPPWHFRNKKTGGNHTSGASQKYSTMPTVDLCRLPVRDLAAKNAIAFVWGTAAMDPDAREVLAAWGFTYKAQLVWVKTTAAGTPCKGLGSWFANAAEFLLIGTRGKVPALRCKLPNVVIAPRGPHSVKPEAVWQVIETAIDNREDLKPRLEMFARGPPRPGWHGWGNQCEGGIALPDLERVTA